MKKNGFTLIELLGVIVILALLIILVFPSIVNSVKNSSKKTDDLTLELIYSAADMYISDHADDFSRKDGSKKVIKLKDLVDEGLLESPIKLSDDDDITNSKCIQISYNGGYKYELKDSGTCDVIFANGEEVYFNVTTGKVCSANEAVSTTGTKSGCMKFYAFNDIGKDTVNLLLDHNTTREVYWNYDGWETGPNELLTKLKEDTDSWNGTETPENYTINQGTGKANYTIKYKDDGYKARLITANEVAQITKNTNWDEKTSTSKFYFDTNTTNASETCKSGNTSGCKYGWLYDRTTPNCTTYGCLNNSDDFTVGGYWTSTSSAYSSYCAWLVSHAGTIMPEDVAELNYGVRPVIEVSKTKFSE